MAELPTGTLTLLFSDIEGSTALVHQLGPDWAHALSRQRVILRAAFDANGGTEMGTEGDSFFVVFRSARQAIQAAMDGQRGLQHEPWPQGTDLRVRMGLHTGEPQRHEDGYIGEDVHRAARIGSTAHGGQIVFSAATERLIGSLPGVEIRDLGYHRLKDMPESEQLFDLVASGLRHEFPPLRSLGRRAALPTAPTALLGRDHELESLQALLAAPTARLITLTGSGGSGKTRLATAVAARLASTYPDGVFFVGLHTADRGDVMWSMIGDVIDAGSAADADPAGRVTRHLADRRALLVLDNVEQIPDADVVASTLLMAAPGVQILASSRRPLLLAGEQEYPVSPLALPSSADFDEVLNSPAVELFVRQARLAHPSFELSADNCEAVAAVVRQLDGLPLALELAAAHSRVLSPSALLKRLDGHLGTGVTASDRPERQRSLEATIGWSYDLLSEFDQASLRRLGVLRSNADLDAVSAIANLHGGSVLETVSRLVDTSLIEVVEGADGEPRVALLETIRSFALRRLEQTGEEDEVRLRHLRWCADFVERTAAQLLGRLHTVALDRLNAIDNDIRAALDFASKPTANADQIALGQQLLIDVTTRYWYRFGNFAEARQWQERGLRTASGHDSEAEITLLHGLAMSMLQQAEEGQAIELIDRSLALSQRLGNRDFEARALNDLGIAHRQQGQLEKARQCLQESLAICQETGNRQREAIALGNLVVVHIDLGESAQAVAAAEESIRVNTLNGDDWGIALDRLNYLTAALNAYGAQCAQARFRDWARSILSFRDHELNIGILEVGGAIACDLDEAAVAVRLLGAADAYRARIPLPRGASEEVLVGRWRDAARIQLSEQDWRLAYESGADVSPDQGVTLVETIEANLRK